MLSAGVRRFIVAVMVLALMGGTTVQAMPPSTVAKAGNPVDMADDCPHRAMMHPMHQGSMPAMPHKSSLDCIKQMGCLGTPSLPVRLSICSAPLTYHAVSYCVPDAVGIGRTIKPDLLPPIGS